ncbi:MAG: FemAB family XrtA/PEP-CTERM system-associated protein [Thermodesulfobacteriota bacterium]
MEVKILKKENDLWEDYVQRSPVATNYHQSGWQGVIEKSFGHETYYLMAIAGGTARGILPLAHMRSRLFGNFLVSLPFFNYGGIIADDSETVEKLISSAVEIAKDLGADYIEFRHLYNKLPLGRTKEHKVTMILDLKGDIDSQWKAFNAKLRNQIRKAEKSGLQIKIGGLEDIPGFYEVFAENMRDLGTPVYGRAFFQNVLTSFPENAGVFSVIFQDRVIASGIASWFKDTFEVPWASSIREYRALCPNNLLYWEAIKFSIENGFKKFDFGRSTPGEGTYKFKEQWGAGPIQLYWQYWMKDGRSLPELNPKNPRYQLAIKVWQRLPLALTKVLGPRIVRNIP